MPAKNPQKTDWRRELNETFGELSPRGSPGPDLKGRELLALASSQSKGNEGRFPAIKSRDDLLRVLAANVYFRQNKGKPAKKPVSKRLKGLFGGGE
jgi:hypothetical protein